MKKVLRLQKVSAKKGGKPAPRPRPLEYSPQGSKAHVGSNWYSAAHYTFPSDMK